MSPESRLKPEQVRLERLLRLLAALINTSDFLPIEELVKRVGVSSPQYKAGYPEGKTSAKRAFHRDQNELADAGIPVIAGPVPRTERETWGYRIRPQDYSLPEIDLDADELAALHRAATAVRFEGVSGSEALWKLGGTVGEGTNVELAEVPVLPVLADLFLAVVEQRVAEFTYNEHSRSVEPWTLAFDLGYWYLVGHDRFRDARRTFRVDRIEGAVTLGHPGGYQQPEEAVGWVPLQPWKFGPGPEIIARLRVDAGQVVWASRRLGQDLKETEPNGDAVFEVVVRHRDSFRSLVLEFLEHAEILGPHELREDLIRWLEQVGS